MAFDVKHAAREVENFLKNDVLKQVLHERKMLYFEQWLASNDPSERERIFAEARAFDSLEVALQAVVNAGLHESAQANLERRSQ